MPSPEIPEEPQMTDVEGTQSRVERIRHIISNALDKSGQIGATRVGIIPPRIYDEIHNEPHTIRGEN